jgi:hypothetical protein
VVDDRGVVGADAGVAELAAVVGRFRIRCRRSRWLAVFVLVALTLRGQPRCFSWVLQ